jgi:hypothetical protein
MGREYKTGKEIQSAIEFASKDCKQQQAIPQHELSFRSHAGELAFCIESFRIYSGNLVTLTEFHAENGYACMQGEAHSHVTHERHPGVSSDRG